MKSSSSVFILLLLVRPCGAVESAFRTAFDVPAETLTANIDRVIKAIAKTDNELANDLRRQLDTARQVAEKSIPASTIQKLFDPHCLLEVYINPEARVKVTSGPAPATLDEKCRRIYLIKVINDAGVTAPLRAFSKQFVTARAQDSRAEKSSSVTPADERWLEFTLVTADPFTPRLTGTKLEYRVVRLRPRARGKRSAVVSMDIGQGTADIGFRNETVLNFVCRPLLESRRPGTDDELQRWLQNMVWYHRYTLGEIQTATGLTSKELREALDRFNISPETRPARASNEALLLLPHPGGRHPRIGFLEGAIRPQRETKANVFTPWDDSSYVVLDVPEAIWSNLGLTYLAHTHIATIWNSRGEKLRQLEWSVSADGVLECERRLPNEIRFGARLTPHRDAVRMEMWLTNGTDQTLTDLRVQNCVLLKHAAGFQQQTNENKIFWGRFAACRDTTGQRWVITSWEPQARGLGNANCPCLHSDPQFPDTAPGQTRRIRGWLSFYEGANVHEEFLRIDREDWLSTQQ